MKKSSGYDENNSDEFPNFELNIFDEPLSKVKRFANLSEREINDLVGKRHSDKTKNQQIGPYQPFEVSMCSSNILELLFSDLATVKKKNTPHNLSEKKYFWDLNVFGEQTLHKVFRLAFY